MQAESQGLRTKASRAAPHLKLPSIRRPGGSKPPPQVSTQNLKLVMGPVAWFCSMQKLVRTSNCAGSMACRGKGDALEAQIGLGKGAWLALASHRRVRAEAAPYPQKSTLSINYDKL